jgi:PAS domain S-box-containing protein
LGLGHKYHLTTTGYNYLYFWSYSYLSDLKELMMKKLFRGTVGLAEFLIYLVIAVSYIELGAWYAYSRGLFEFLSEYVYMAPATSIVTILLGAGILFWYYRKNHKAYQYSFVVIMSVVFAYSLFTLLNHIFSGSISEVSRQFNPEKQLAKVFFFDLSPFIAVLSILIVLILQTGIYLKQDNKLRRNLEMIFSIAIFALCYLVGLEYISGVPLFYVANVIPVGLPSILLFAIILIAIQLLKGKNSWMLKIFLERVKVKSMESTTISRSLMFYFAILVLVISFAGSFFVRISYNVIRTNAVNDLKSVNAFISEQISTWYRKQISEVTSVQNNKYLENSALAVINQNADAKAKKDIEQWMSSYTSNYQYLDASLYNKKGTRLISTSKSDSPSGYSSDSLFTSIIREKSIHITESNDVPTKSKKFRTVLNIWIPINDNNPDNDSAGLWLLRINPETELYPIADQCRFFIKNGESIIISRDADLITVLNQSQYLNNPALQPWVNSKIYGELLDKKGIAKVNNVFDGLDYKKKPVFVTISPIIHTQWYLLVKVDNKEVFRPLMFNIIIALTFVITIIILLSFVISVIERNKDKNWYKQQLDLVREKNQAEEALHDVELSYRNILDNLLEGCQILDADYKYVYVNLVFMKQFNKTQDELINNNIFEVFPDFEKTKMANSLKLCMQDKTSQKQESKTKLGDGSTGWLNYKFQAISDQVIIFTSDITEQKLADLQIKKMNAELEQKIQERTEQLQIAYNEMESFSYSVSHDLRAPLRSITSFSEVLETSYKTQLDEKGQDFLTRICNAAKRMGDLIDDILKLSRISRTPLKIQEIDLKVLINKVLGMTIPADTVRKSKFELDVEGSIEGDESLLIIALTNIIDNAWKFTSKKEETYIKIFTVIADCVLNLVIVDNGAGFDMKFAGNLFAPFQRLHKMEEFHGTGIGLTIVQRIMQKHNGTVSIESVKDAGTTIYLKFNLKGEENDGQDNSID